MDSKNYNVKAIFLCAPILLTLLLPPEVYGDSYLCTGEAAAGIVHSSDGRVETFTSDVSKMQWLMTSSGGKWIVKEVNTNHILPLVCRTEFFCETKGGDTFWRGTDGYFEHYKRQPSLHHPKFVKVGIIGGRCINTDARSNN